MTPRPFSDIETVRLDRSIIAVRCLRDSLKQNTEQTFGFDGSQSCTDKFSAWLSRYSSVVYAEE